MEYRKQAHATYYANYHLVFGTKYRRKVLRGGVGAYALLTMRDVAKIFPEVTIGASNANEDHVHLEISIPPKYAVSEIVGYLKGKSAHALRKRFAFLDRVYYGSDGIWSDGYFISTVGVNEATIRRYIEMQGREDGGQVKLVF